MRPIDLRFILLSLFILFISPIIRAGPTDSPSENHNSPQISPPVGVPELSASDVMGVDPNGIPVVCGGIGGRESGPKKKSGAVSSALPASTRGWSCIPCVIKNDGLETFRLEVNVNGPVNGVSFSPSFFIDASPQTSPIQLRDDGLGVDLIAGDNIYTGGPFRFNVAAIPFFPPFFNGENSLNPAGLATFTIGDLSVQETDTSTSQFLIAPDIGVLRSDILPPQIDAAAPNILRSPHLINIQSNIQATQTYMRLLTNNISQITQPIYAALPDAFDILFFFSTDKIESIPQGSGRNFVAGTHIAIKTNYTGTGLTPMDGSAAYGSSGKLLGANILDINFRGLNSSVSVHELSHQWLAYMGLLSDGVHYYPQSSVGSLIGGFEWILDPQSNYVRNCNVGTNEAVHAPPLDLYMMGLIDSSQVAPLHFSDLSQPIDDCGAVIEDSIATVTIEDIQTSNGVRSPGPPTAQHDFHLGFVAETNGRLFNSTEMTFYEILAEHFTSSLPPEVPDPNLTRTNWVPMERYFGNGTAWSSDVPAPLIPTPSASPTSSPTATPSRTPSTTPTKSPTSSPSPTPSKSPSATPSKSPTFSPSPTPSQSPSVTPSKSPTSSPTPSASPSLTPSPSASQTSSPTASTTPSSTPTPSPTASATQTPTPSASPTPGPTVSATNSPTASPTPSPSASSTPSQTPSATPSMTTSPTPSQTATPTQSASPTPSQTASPTNSATQSPTPNPTASVTPSMTASPTPSQSQTPAPSASPTPSQTANSTNSPTQSPTPSPTASSTPSMTPSATPSGTPTSSPSASPTASPTASFTPSATPSQTSSATPSATPSSTPSSTPSPTSSKTPSPTPSPSTSPTGSPSPSVTATESQTPSATPSASASPSETPSPSPTVSPTPSRTPTSSATPSRTPSATASPSPTPSSSATPSATPSPSPSATKTKTPTATPSQTPSKTPSRTPSPTPSRTPTPSPSASLTPSATPSISPSSTPTTTPSDTPTETPTATPAETETPTPTPIPIDDAAYVSSTVPQRSPVGSTIGVGITLRNLGNTTWSSDSADGYFLAITRDDCSIFEDTLVPLRESDTDIPLMNYQFVTFLHLPPTPGSCTFAVQMFHVPDRFFGPEVTFTIDVFVPPNSVTAWELYE